MDKQPVGQLPDLTQSNNDDEIMVITNDEYNQLKKEKISDFITDLQSTNTNNSLTTGSDGKLFVSKTINASDVDGVLSLDNIPQLSTNKLPETGISADNYSYPSSITVNDRGQVVSIVEGSAAEAGAYLDQSQITNCILSAPNGVATYSGDTITIKQGLKVLIPNGRNEDKSLKNIEYTVPEDKTINYTEGNQTYDFTLLYGNTGVFALSQNYQEVDTPPTFYGYAQYYLNTKENIMYFNNNNERWEPRTVAVLGKGRLENGIITDFQPFGTVSVADDQTVLHKWGDETAYGNKTFANGITVLNTNKPNSYQFITTISPEVDFSNPQPSQRGFSLRSLDKNNNTFCAVNGQTNNQSSIETVMYSFKKSGEDTLQSYVGACIDRANNTYAYCTTYTGNYADSTTKIVTTAFLTNRWVTSKATTSSTASKARPAVVIQNYVSGANWYRIWSDGWIEQGGRAQLTDSWTITFPKAFTNTNYVFLSASEGKDANCVLGVMDRTTTKINGNNADQRTLYYNWRACGY